MNRFFRACKTISSRAVGRRGLLLSAGAVALLLASAGCEVDSADSSVNIDPSSAHVNHVGQTITLTAYGGYNYRWSLSNREIGMLNTYRGNQVQYTSLVQPVTMPKVQVVKVSSFFSDNTSEGATGNHGTNQTPTNVETTAEAYITHIPLAPTSTN